MTGDKSSVATSSYSEEYFREVKQLVMKGKSVVRVDKFLVIHMRSLAGTTKILHALHQNSRDALEPRQTKSQIKRQNKNEFTRDDAKLTKYSKADWKNDNESSNNNEDVIDENEITGDMVRLSKEKVIPAEIMKGENKMMGDKVRKVEIEVMMDNVTVGEDEVLGDDELGRPLILPPSGKAVDSTGTANNFSNTYLNEKESWKGKSRNKKKRGKFLRPCPDIQHRHRRPKSVTFTVPLLINGLLLGPVKLNNKYIIVRNTCPIDSVSQSMLVAYRDWAHYQEYIDSTENCFFDFVKLLDKSGCTMKIYKKRAEIMSQFNKIDGGVLDCITNVSNLIKYLISDQPSYTAHHHCMSCKREDMKQSVVVEVDVKQFYTHGIKILEQVIRDQLQQKKQCAVCKSHNVASTITTGNHMIVDIECLQWTRLAENLGHPDWPGTLTLSQIPEKLAINNVTYTLQTAIEFVGSSKSAVHNDVQSERQSMGHYIAHVRRVTGRWEVHNDLQSGGKSMTATSRMLLEKRKLSVLIFIKSD